MWLSSSNKGLLYGVVDQQMMMFSFSIFAAFKNCFSRPERILLKEQLVHRSTNVTFFKDLREQHAFPRTHFRHFCFVRRRPCVLAVSLPDHSCVGMEDLISPMKIGTSGPIFAKKKKRYQNSSQMPPLFSYNDNDSRLKNFDSS